MIYHTSLQTKNIEVAEPARPKSFKADFLVPFCQAVALGALFGVPIGGKADGWTGAAMTTAIFAGLILTALIIWQHMQPPGQSRHVERSQQAIPVLRPLDARRPAPGVVVMNGAGQPAPRTQAEADQVDTARLIRFVRGCEQYGTSSHYWEGRIARPVFVALRAELIRAGHAAWRGATPRDGWYLTKTADEIVAAIHKPEAQPK